MARSIFVEAILALKINSMLLSNGSSWEFVAAFKIPVSVIAIGGYVESLGVITVERSKFIILGNQRSC